ncbi:MAG TPA: type II toxin-antitoxin system VapC family toxin [Solirubrobacterales bacterium]|nr:type II toxin-antitoxin system VapC family toxin [Solirubrobacterales bacterium]
MKLLLDTHAMIWVFSAPGLLSAEARNAISAEGNEVFISVISPWEVEIKRAKKRLRAPDDLSDAVEAHRFQLLPVLLRHTKAIGSMPDHHGDPFDRMLVAQATVDGLTLVTSDRTLRRYPIATLQAS